MTWLLLAAAIAVAMTLLGLVAGVVKGVRVCRAGLSERGSERGRPASSDAGTSCVSRSESSDRPALPPYPMGSP